MVRAGLTVERVTEAAAELADVVGFENVTLSALARSFGVKDASLYSHVKNVSDLRTRVAVLAAREFADRLTTAVAGRAGRDALVAFAGAYRDFVLECPGRYAATQLRIDPEVLAGSLGHQRLIEATLAMIRGYALPEPDRTDAVRLLRSVFHGYAGLEAAEGFQHSRAAQASWDRNVEALHFLLTHWSTATAGTETPATESGAGQPS